MVGDIVIYRSFGSVRGVAIKDLNDKKGQIVDKRGSVVWQSIDFEGALPKVLDYNKYAPND